MVSVVQRPDLASRPFKLKNGAVALIRPARPGDAPKIRRAFRELGAETRYNRFLGYKNEVSEAELARIANVDFSRECAFLVTIGDGESEFVIGGASFFALDDETPPQRAEVAFTIEEDFQGQGLATELMRRIAESGRAVGLRRFEAEVLGTNQGMLSVFKRSGLPISMRLEEGVVHVALEL
ncbi:GNAT family N-acetyltransferase [Methylocella sp.]|uniref:GNAT family N-acetyltransferase n=1 Tax=Methylocella sp. TaxID=1978226 RepID=UPI0037839266